MNELFLKLSKYFSMILILTIIISYYNCECKQVVNKFGVSSDTFGERSSVAFLPGDFIFGALYSIHHQPKQKSEKGLASSSGGNLLKCGEIREMYGIQRIEVTFQTLDIINKNPNILPNITLGVEIRDSCWYAPVALRQSIELIRDSISMDSGVCVAEDNNNDAEPNGLNSEKRQRRPLIGVIGPGSSSVALQVQNLLQLFHIPQIGYSTTSKDLSDKSRFNYFMRVVPSDYYQAQVIVDIVKRFNWTYVSAVHTSENYGQAGIQAFRELAERSDICIAKEDSVLSTADDNEFEKVINTLVEDASAQVVVCFCEGMTVRGLLRATKRLNLTGRFLIIGSDGWADRHDVTDNLESEAHGSISIRIHSPYVHSFDDYYLSLRPETNLRNPWFREFWQYKFECRFADENSTNTNATSSMMTNNFNKRKKRQQTNVNFQFNDKNDITMTMARSTMADNSSNHQSPEVIDLHTILLHSANELITSFQTITTKEQQEQREQRQRDITSTSGYVENGVTMSTTMMDMSNTNMDELIDDLHAELTSSTMSTTLTTANIANNMRFCTGKESLKKYYKQDPKLNFVIKAIYTLAYGLHSMQQDLCGRNSIGLCPQLYPFNGSLFKSYLMNVSFTLEDGEAVEFDSRGDPPGRYDIMNFQLLDDGTYHYVQVGDWNNGTLSFTSELQFGIERGLTPPDSVCSKPCDPGFYKNSQKGGQDKRCCWICVPCRANEMLVDERSCKKCPPGTWPDANKTQCNHIPVEFVQWNDTQAIVAIVFSCIGFVSTAFGSIVFIRYNNTPVVKSSTRELSYLILAGMTLSHAATFPIISKPSGLSCALSRTMPGISFAMIYASLLTKTNRIARILAGSKKRFPTRKPRFMSATSQVLITCFLISIEIGCAIFMLVYEPADATFQYPALDRVILVCNTSPAGVLAPLAFDFFLILLCTVYALKTRNVPENFNEAKFIGFAMYTTCVIWIAFVPIYFGSETKIITMCICVTLSALVIFLFLFIPKLYIILLRPERNNRALFTTSKSIRCHIGSRVASALSEKSSFSSSGFQDSQSAHWRAETDSSIHQSAHLNLTSHPIGLSTKPHVNWKDQSSKMDGVNSVIAIKKAPEKRTLSCQTGNELLHFLIQTHLLSLRDMQVSSQPQITRIDELSNNTIQHNNNKWSELNVRTLMDADGTRMDTSAVLRCRANTGTPKLLRRARIREESASDASLSDNDSCQLKNITISLGSVSSIIDCNHHPPITSKSANGGKLIPIDNHKSSITSITTKWNKTNHINSPAHSLV